MARSKIIKLAVLNVKFEDRNMQNPNKYAELWKDVQIKRIYGKTLARQCLIVATAENIIERSSEDGICGSIYKFLDLNPDSPWLNTSRMEPIDPNEGTPLPPDVKPEYKAIGYAFYPRRHRLVFDAGIVSPKSAQKAMQNMFAHPEITGRFGAIEVLVESSRDVVEKIILLPRIHSLDIVLSIPNSDELSGLDREVYNRMKRDNINRERIHQSSKHLDGLSLGDLEKSKIRLSGSNGRTTVTVQEEGRKVEHSTENSPLLHIKKYNPEEQSYNDAMLDGSGEIWEQL